MSTETQHAFLVRLLFDEELREAFFNDAEATASVEGLPPDDVEPHAVIDPTGLGVRHCILRPETRRHRRYCGVTAGENQGSGTERRCGSRCASGGCGGAQR